MNYPIYSPETPAYTSLVDQLRGDLRRDQFCVLPDFLTPAVLATAIDEVNALHPQAYANASRRNCYLRREKDSALSDDHPANIFFEASYRIIANDLFSAGSPLQRLYHDNAVMRLVSDIVEAPELYPSADPYQPVNVLCYSPGDNSAWHFDSSNAFTMTLMLQSADEGGEFEIVPNTRSDDDPMHDELAKVLRGDRNRVVTVPRDAGALVIFRGCNSVHRVTDVKGGRPRLMAVFVYETAPGVIGDPFVNETVYGPRTRAG
jgi:hypothetical protein